MRYSGIIENETWKAVETLQLLLLSKARRVRELREWKLDSLAVIDQIDTYWETKDLNK